MVTFGLILGAGVLLMWFTVARPFVRALEGQIDREGQNR